jgi:hypothetical protein
MTQKSFLYDTDETLEVLPAMREIDEFLRGAGYTPKRTGREKGFHGCTVCRADYIRDNQNIFVIVNNAGRNMKREDRVYPGLTRTMTAGKRPGEKIIRTGNQ